MPKTGKSSDDDLLYLYDLTVFMMFLEYLTLSRETYLFKTCHEAVCSMDLKCYLSLATRVAVKIELN
jgi:hypothetical protein